MKVSKDNQNFNFIAPATDRFGTILRWSLTYGLVITVIVVLFVMGTSYYSFYLKQNLNKVNAQIDSLANQISDQKDFESKFLLTQEKLQLYSDINNNEKMADLFPKLSALTPEGVQLKDLIIEPDTVEIFCYVTDQTALSQFVNNLSLANNATFDDGQKLAIGNPNVREIAKNSDQSENQTGYNFSLSFNYVIE